MQVEVKPGKYVLALSGGVDSIVLLDLLSNLEGVELVLAHFNHGIRTDAVRDEDFVRQKAKDYRLILEVGQGNLGAQASEETAREARYKFLRDICDRHEANTIITAHHQDDMLETAIINILRGTGPQGLMAMQTNPDIVRPLLEVPKKDIVTYAQAKKLEWVEDESNDDLKYLRNYIRSKLMSKLQAKERQEILARIDQVTEEYQAVTDIYDSVADYIFIDEDTLDRQAFIFLPDAVAKEMLARWLRHKRIPADRKTINRLAVAIKTARPHTKQGVSGRFFIEMDVQTATLETDAKQQ
jgi:tRNA(Ile)-lysidine synthetase-like protein